MLNLLQQGRRKLRPLGVERLLYAYGRVKGRRKLRRLRPDLMPPDAALERLRERQLVFSLSAGRTGSEYLTRLMALLPDTTSFHEPEPAFQRVMRPALRNPSLARDFLEHYKLPALAATEAGTIVETSHLFGKGFVEPMLELGVRPSVINLHREPRAVALSYLTRYTVPARTRYGWTFLLQPDDPGVLPISPWRDLTDYQLCYWYALETERRIDFYSGMLREQGALVIDTSAQALNDAGEFLRVAALLKPGLNNTQLKAVLSAHTALSRQRHNANPRGLNQRIDFDTEETELMSRIPCSYRQSLLDSPKTG